MIFSYNWLQSFFEKRLPKPEKLAELLTMHSFEVSEVKRVGKDFALDIDVLPNRGPDCFSHIGIARECAALTELEIKDPFGPNSGQGQKSKIIEDKNIKAKDFIKVEIKNQKACPRYTARVIIGVKVAPSPKWLKEKLKICGIKPINNVVDVANFVMLETGQPLHAFDGEKLEGKKIIVRFAKEREKIVTLDEEKYDLNSDILVIADTKKPVAIAGIKGGIMPEINKKTKIAVLESANFNPRVIRRVSKKLGLRTDASWRFEHGIDPNLTEKTINRAASLVQKIAGGKIAQGLIDFYPKKVFPKKIKLDLNYVDRLLGVKILEKEIKNIFKRLGFKLKETTTRPPPSRVKRGPLSSPLMVVEVPTFRLDISLPEDLIEEIGRISGFQRIPEIYPLVSLILPKRNIDRFWGNLSKDTLKETGFIEVYNYSFIGQNLAKIFGYQPKDLIETENPMSLEQKYLRPSLIPNLLKNVKENMKNFEEIKIFELGKIFRKYSSKKILEKRVLTGLILKKEKKAKNFYELKGICDLLLEKMGISNFWYDTYKPTPEESKISIWHIRKCAEIKIDHQEIGFLGEITPKILEDFKVGNIVVFDFDFEKLQKLATEEYEFSPISKYPAAIRDLAILVPLEVRIEKVLNKIEIAGGSLVRDIDLFDMYAGEEIPEGKKNLAFHIIFQSEVKTLDSKEIDEVHQKIIKALEKEKEWEVRK